MVFITKNFKILNVDGVFFESHQRCLPCSPAKKRQFETVPKVSKNSVGRGSGLLAIWEGDAKAIPDYFGSRILLWGIEHK